MKTKNIVFLIRSLDKGGAEKQLALLASGLKQIGNNVKVLTYYGEANINSNLNYMILRQANVEVISINKHGRYDLIGFLLRYRKILKKVKPDIIYSFLELSNVFACLAKLILPKIKIIWGKRSSYKKLSNYKLGIRIEHILEKLLCKVPDLIIANSEKGLSYMQVKKYNARIVVVNNGIVTNGISGEDIRYLLFQQCDIKSDDILIGAVGRLDYAKDYETLIHSFNLTIKQNKNLKLLIVGREVDPDYAKHLYSLIQLYNIENKVFFLSEMENISDFYSSIDFFVSSSYTEGFSNVIGEAMVHELVCIVTDAGDSQRLVGNTAIVVPIRNAQALSDGILLALTKDRKVLGKLAKDRVNELFTVDKMVINTNKYLDEICEN